MTELAREFAPAPPPPPPVAARLAAVELPLAQRGLLDGRFTFIDGLRGIAALGVVTFHLHRITHLAGPAWLMWPVSVILTHGDLGVSIFFVISGFVMAHSLRNAWISPSYFGNFVFRRSLRLDPPYWAVIGLALLAQWLLPTLAAGPPQHVALWPHFLYLQDILGPYRDNSIDGVFWTLCLEVQFYLAFILCLCLVQQIQTRYEHQAAAAHPSSTESPTSPPRRRHFQAVAMIVFMPLLLGSLLMQHDSVKSALPKKQPHTGKVSVFATKQPASPIARSPRAATVPAFAPPRQPSGVQPRRAREPRTAPRADTDLNAANPVASPPPVDDASPSRSSKSSRRAERGLSLSNWKHGFFLRYWYTFFLGVMIYWALGRAVHVAWLIAAAAAIAIMMAVDWRDLSALNHTAMVLAAAGTIFTVGHAGKLGRWFGGHVLQYLGRISYSLYLIHLVVAEPLVNWLIKLHPPARGQSAWISWFHFFAGLAISLLAADILYRLIERPAVKFSKRFKPRRPTNEPAEPVQAELVGQALPA